MLVCKRACEFMRVRLPRCWLVGKSVRSPGAKNNTMRCLIGEPLTVCGSPSPLSPSTGLWATQTAERLSWQASERAPGRGYCKVEIQLNPHWALRAAPVLRVCIDKHGWIPQRSGVPRRSLRLACARLSSAHQPCFWAASDRIAAGTSITRTRLAPQSGPTSFSCAD